MLCQINGIIHLNASMDGEPTKAFEQYQRDELKASVSAIRDYDNCKRIMIGAKRLIEISVLQNATYI